VLSDRKEATMKISLLMFLIAAISAYSDLYGMKRQPRPE